MFMDIFAYIDQLFHIIKPRKVFYMAVDGTSFASLCQYTYPFW